MDMIVKDHDVIATLQIVIEGRYPKNKTYWELNNILVVVMALDGIHQALEVTQNQVKSRCEALLYSRTNISITSL